jgi:hypothetical protein
MNTNNNTSMNEIVARYIADTILGKLATRYADLGNRAFARRAYRIESEMTGIASEVSAYARIPSEQVERFLVALAKAKRPAVKLELPKVEGLSLPTVWRPGMGAAKMAARKVAVMADWSPSCK